MVVKTSANSRDSLTVSSISSLVIRVHLAQIRTFSSVGVNRTAFSYAYALQKIPAILLWRSISASFSRISFFAFSSSTAMAAASSRCSSGTSWS